MNLLALSKLKYEKDRKDQLHYNFMRQIQELLKSGNFTNMGFTSNDSLVDEINSNGGLFSILQLKYFAE